MNSFPIPAPAPASGRGRGMAGAFSLIEVMLALGLFSFVVVILLGLFSIGLRSSRDSEQEIQAANLASYIVNTLPLSATTVTTNNIPPAIAYASLAAGYAQVNLGNGYIGLDGAPTNSAEGAAYAITCSAGTNSTTGASLSQVYLMLSWPARANPTNAAGHYEFLTYLPLH